MDGPSPGRVTGYAAVFDKLSEDLGGFRERMAPFAFDGITNGADIRMFWNHDSAMPIGRTRSGTARIAPDTQGLHFEVDLPDTTYARDLWEAIERGDVSGASIGFYIGDESWSNDEAGNPVRTITRVSQLVEASIVSIPAYPDTAIAITRAMEGYFLNREAPSWLEAVSNGLRECREKGIGTGAWNQDEISRFLDGCTYKEFFEMRRTREHESREREMILGRAELRGRN